MTKKKDALDDLIGAVVGYAAAIRTRNEYLQALRGVLFGDAATPPAGGNAELAELFRKAAAGRQEYAKSAPTPRHRELLKMQAHTLESAAKVIEGDMGPMYDWLPARDWTPEMLARMNGDG